MEFLNKIEWTPLNILKALGVLLVALIALSIVINLIKPLTGSLYSTSRSFPSMAPSHNTMYGTDGDYRATSDMAYEESASVKLSAQNIGIPTPQPGTTVGGDAEDFEVTEYSASIETQNGPNACSEISALKERDYVIFENANENNRGCNYRFKAEHEKASEILAVIESLNPKHLNENTQTIKSQLDDFTSETEILENKLESINETLENAINAYDEISQLATRTQDAESLTKIIDSKISTIERLTQQRINITSQLERLSRAKAEQMDRLTYTYFNVTVYENKFIDKEDIKESWKSSVKTFVRDINQTAQDLTINLISLLFSLVQVVIYFVILLLVLKYLWRFTKSVWNK